MTSPCGPVPKWNEQDRLTALRSYDILDTPQEEDFEEIVNMAARVCNTPISVINLVAGDRQWFKAERGLGLRETPLDVSICAQAILQPGVFSVADLSQDARFQSNPLVVGDPRLRFYAGALLETPEGLPLGTMCVLDYKPRTLTEQESATLKGLARQVMTLLELRRALASKSRSEERLKLALEISGFIGMWEWDIAKDRVTGDDRFVSAFGGDSSWTIEGAPIADYLKVIHPDDRPRVSAAIEHATKTKEIYRQEYRLRQSDGAWRWIEAGGKCQFDETGKPVQFPGAAIDVNERHQAQARAEFLNQLTQKISLLSGPEVLNRVATWEVGQFLGGNRCYFFEAISPDRHTRVLPDWCLPDEESLQGVYDLATFGEPKMWETLKNDSASIDDLSRHPWTSKFIESYGAIHIGAALIAPFSRDGKWVACLAVSAAQPRHWLPEERELLENVMLRVWPLIERARIELELRRSEERFRAMSDNIAPLAWMAHSDGLLFWYNKRWYDYTGGTLEEMQGDGWTRVHDPEQLPHVMETWKTAIAQGHPWEDTFPLRGADGNFRWFLSRAFPIRDAEGRITLWFGVNTDITDLREAQNALKKANGLLGDKAAHLESLVQERTHKLSETIGELEAFSYSISHDMRAPLRSMISFSEILLEECSPQLDATGVDYLHRISKASRRMDQLIQDVLVFSRLGRDEFVPTAIDSDVLLREIVGSYPNLHPDLVTIQIKSSLPFVRGNEALLTQCFSNLLENATKFVAKGMKPVIDVWAEVAGDQTRLYFQDNGIGMSPHNLERIFEIFHRVGRDNDGTGIGLAIVRKSAERMGGSISVTSEPGRGSLFWLTLVTAEPTTS